MSASSSLEGGLGAGVYGLWSGVKTHTVTEALPKGWPDETDSSFCVEAMSGMGGCSNWSWCRPLQRRQEGPDSERSDARHK